MYGGSHRPLAPLNTSEWPFKGPGFYVYALSTTILSAYPYKPVTKDTEELSGNQKTLLTIDKRDQKSLETVFLIAICRQLGDKWQ